MGGLPLRRWRVRALGKIGMAVSAFAALGARSAPARAQQAAAPLIPIVTPLRGDDLFAHQYGPSVTAAFAPLRLSLTSGLFAQAGAYSGCDSRTDASGNSVSGFAVQYESFVHLAPQLVLHGFSSLGCQVDAGMGSGITYAIPLRPSLWLVPSVGAYAMPRASGGNSLVTTAAQVDLVKQLAWGGTLSFGLGTRSGNGRFDALHFGGSF